MRSKRAFKRLLDMCLGICEAMLFLESRYIIHRDLGRFIYNIEKNSTINLNS